MMPVRARPKTKKITVEVPADVLERATGPGEGVTDVVRRALELRANQQAWQRWNAGPAR